MCNRWVARYSEVFMSYRIERELWLTAAPEEVWDVITGADWLADEVFLDLSPGGDAVFRSREWEKTGWVEEATPGERLAFWWETDGEPATRVQLTLSRVAASGGTLLRIVETRPLDVLDLVGTPLPGVGGRTYGPALIAA
jgi:uncharacterized protein YndB with AHSA1/START domain